MKNKSNFSKIITFLMIFTLILSPLSGVLAQEDNAETVVNEETIEGEEVTEVEETENTEEPVKEEEVTTEETENPEDTTEPTENVDNSEEQVKNDRKLTIIHTNDIHGRYTYTKSTIGFPKYKTFLDQKRAEGTTITLDSGDTVHGTNFANLSEGQTIVDLLEMIGLDAMVPGNHEFNYGFARLKELTDSGHSFKTLAANVFEGESKAYESHHIFEKDGIKIGVLGIATPESKYKSNPKNTVGVDIKNEALEADKSIKALKEQGADVIIVLSHLGTDSSSEINTFTVLDGMKMRNDITVLLDGHSHTTYPEGHMYKNVLIASTGAFFKNVGVVEVVLKEDGSTDAKASLKTLEQFADVEENEEIKAYIEKAEEKNKEITSQVIGETTTRLDGEREKVRGGETNLTNLITDAILKETQADVVLTNGGGIRTSIEAGKITRGQALEVLPFGNVVTVIRVTGQNILDALSHGAGDFPELKGAFPQVAGMTYTIYLKDGKVTIGDVKIGGEKLVLDKEYNLATNDFMAIGGDEYTMFAGTPTVQTYRGMLEMFEDYIKELSKNGPFTAILDSRMKVVEGEPEPDEEPIPELKLTIEKTLVDKKLEDVHKDLPIEVNKVFNKHDYKVFDIKVKNTSGDYVTQLQDPLDVKLTLEEIGVSEKDLPSLKLWTVHDSELEEIKDFEVKDGELMFKRAKFSDFAFVYGEKNTDAKTPSTPSTNQKTNQKSNPKTGDVGISLSVMAFVAAAGGAVVLKKKK